MVPPLLLDVRPGHKVLDMCAAPGSKTAQIVEALHATENQDGIPGSLSILTIDGLVLANDSDGKRCHILIHQLQRLQTPCLIVTNHEAQMLPGIRIKGEGGELQSILFDRILCDVPCRYSKIYLLVVAMVHCVRISVFGRNGPLEML